MTDNNILVAVKTDLQISARDYDEYLLNLIELAKAAVGKEGISLADTVEDGMMVAMYAAYLYRQRRDSAAMPRSLRYALNNRLLSERSGIDG